MFTVRSVPTAVSCENIQRQTNRYHCVTSVSIGTTQDQHFYIYTGVYTKHITHIVIRTGSELISYLLGGFVCIMHIFYHTSYNPRQNRTLKLFSRQNHVDHVRCFTPRQHNPCSSARHNKACDYISRLFIWENISRSTDTHVPLKYYDAIVCSDHTNLDGILAYFEYLRTMDVWKLHSLIFWLCVCFSVQPTHLIALKFERFCLRSLGRQGTNACISHLALNLTTWAATNSLFPLVWKPQRRSIMLSYFEQQRQLGKPLAFFYFCPTVYRLNVHWCPGIPLHNRKSIV